MPKYLIERSLPGAGALSPAELAAIARTSVGVLSDMQGRAQWLHTYVTADKLVCVYLADNPESLREHATRGGFPCDDVRVVTSIMDPTMGES